MTIDVSKIKPGDKVTLVPLEVINVSRDSDYVAVKLDDFSVWQFDDNQITAHYPAPRKFQKGDRVKHATIGAPGTIEHIARDKAWVMWDTAGDGMALLSNLSFVKNPE